jgi:hypothetical protein
MKIFYLFLFFLFYSFSFFAQSIPISKDSALKIINSYRSRYDNETNRTKKYFIHKEYIITCTYKAYYFYPDPQRRFQENWKKDSNKVESKLKAYRRKFHYPGNESEMEGMKNYNPIKSAQGVSFPSPDSIRDFFAAYPKIFHAEIDKNSRSFIYKQNELYLKLKDYYSQDNPQKAYSPWLVTFPTISPWSCGTPTTHRYKILKPILYSGSGNRNYPEL